MMLILLVALFMFGGKKLPELARGLGRGIREFKDASETIKKDINDQINNFGKDLDVSESASTNSNNHTPSSTKAPTEQVDDYSDGGNRQPEYYGSQSNYYGSNTTPETDIPSDDRQASQSADTPEAQEDSIQEQHDKKTE